VDGAGAHALNYNDAAQLLTESFPDSGVTLTNTYDALLRRSSLALPGQTIGYGYDYASRLQSVTAGSNTVTYAYLPNSSLVSNILFQTGGQTMMTTTKSYDNLNRLAAITSVPSAGSAVSYSYAYNAANQRTQAVLADGSDWNYGYDSLGQVTGGNKQWSDGSAVAGQQFGYAFDDIGNRTAHTANGREVTYTVNSLNQYTQRTVPGYIWEIGSAASNATVTVNLQPVNRHGEYFATELSVNNAASAVYTQLVTVGVLKDAGGHQRDIVSSCTGSVFVAQSPEQFTYDADGNLTGDGRWAYTWDAENRLVGIAPANGGWPQIALTYDYLGRRASRQDVYPVQPSWGLPMTWFVYDGWNLVQAITSIPGTMSFNFQSYVWGLDLSGSEQGAGGIGGLLAVNAGTTGTLGANTNGTHFVAYDGNGNVAALVDAGNQTDDTGGTISAQYEYGPSGELICSTGPMAKDNPFRFSTKYQNDETDLLYYGYRYYQPSTGRWLSRDPIAEGGGANLYECDGNNAIKNTDSLGLMRLDEVQALVNQMNNSLQGMQCCCANHATAGVDVLIAGVASGTTITSRMSLRQHGCVSNIAAYYWWDCFSAQAEALARAPGTLIYGNGWVDYGWHLGDITNSQSHLGGVFGISIPGHFDFNHWAFQAGVIYTICGHDGHPHARFDTSAVMNWTWSTWWWSWMLLE
jgi:RHS repeat-associated protein